MSENENQVTVETAPFQTELSEACRIVEVAHTVMIDTMSEAEQELDVLRNTPHATAVRIVTSLLRDGALELLCIGVRLRPSVFWVVKHIQHDSDDPRRTRFCVISEHPLFDEAETAMSGVAWQARFKVFPSGRVETIVVYLPHASDLSPDEEVIATVPTAALANAAIERFYDERTKTDSVTGITVLEE